LSLIFRKKKDKEDRKHNDAEEDEKAEVAEDEFTKGKRLFFCSYAKYLHFWNILDDRGLIFGIEILENFKRPKFNSKIFGLFNVSEKNHCFLNSVIQVFWNIDSIQEFMIRFAEVRNKADNNLTKELKLLINNAANEDFDKFNDPNSPIDYDIISIRVSLDDAYSESKQFELDKKWDAPEAYEALISQIYSNLKDFNKDLSEEFEDLVDVNMNISTSYIFADELLSPIPFSKTSALEDINNIKYDLVTYLKNYLDLLKSKDNIQKMQDGSSSDEESRGLNHSNFLF
jgi:hypothetical protein